MVKIVKAKPKDFDTIFVLLKELYSKDRLVKKKTKEIFLNFIKREDCLSFVIKKDQIIIGYAAVQIREDIQSQGKIGYLSELILNKDFRGKGIGTRLFKEVIGKSKKAGCREIQFPSSFPRKKAHKFYLLQGFQKTAYFFWKEI
jgi:ribosomal protein S18 acetylase RimI-like enzyme